MRPRVRIVWRIPDVNVVFPLPLSPMIPTISPRPISIDTLSTALSVPPFVLKSMDRLRISMIGSMLTLLSFYSSSYVLSLGFSASSRPVANR